MSITRDLQIDLILGNPNPVIDTFNNICDDLSVIEEDTYHKNGGEFIYYNSNKEWVFFQDNNSNKFWCHYDRYWLIFETKFNYDYEQIFSTTKVLVENILSDIIRSPGPYRSGKKCNIIKTLNKVATPDLTNFSSNNKVKNTLNKISNAVSTYNETKSK